MRCEEVREHLAEHLLGTLDERAEAEVRRHLRGCAACRAEAAALGEGVSTFARAAHDVEPPEELRDRVLSVLDEEWSESPEAPAPGVRLARVGRAAGVAALVAAVAWGVFATVRAERFEDAADRYEAFLGALGGEAVRVGELRAGGSRQLEGTVVIYDSKVGQSWVLVLSRAPGRETDANVTLLTDDERRIDMHPLEFGPGGEASSWLVTASDLTAFHRVNVWDDAGLIASADVARA